MKRGPIDRRVARTRTRLHEALMSLMLKTDYEEIVIRDICEAAKISRSTFYAHYSSKDDLLRSGLDNLRRALIDRQRDDLAVSGDVGRRSLGFSLTLLEHARNHTTLHPPLANGGAVALATVRQIISDLIRNELDATADGKSEDAILRELVVQYVVGAYMAVLTWWLDGRTKLPAQRIDGLFRCLTTEGIGNLLH